MRARNLVVAVLPLAAVALYARVSVTSTLSGTVTDTWGALVPGAAVTVRNSQTGARYNGTTEANGTFSVPSLGTGQYSVTVKAQGFKEAQVSNISLDAGAPANIQIKPDVGAQSESVTVEAAATMLQSPSAAVSTALTGRQIVELPLVSREAPDPEFLNIFNSVNFLVGSPNNDTNTDGSLSAQTFGQVTQAYNYQSTTYDPGGRLVQFVTRLNF
jgi:hypothetical protein